MTTYKAITSNSETVLRGEKFIHGLLHAYDPVKRREYYLRTRELKGRKKTSKLDNSKAVVDEQIKKLSKESAAEGARLALETLNRMKANGRDNGPAYELMLYTYKQMSLKAKSSDRSVLDDVKTRFLKAVTGR